ncbi:DUF4177 domain-containing protein [Yoonia sp.]|uniref:DUF4177 domain-containing protein n=1 Tax=Yoonia sp. TaxID=2212373 RepID=UPI003A4E0341|nr:DUF4177 domain-containing protein [Loktanella sp.]
MTYEYKVVPAPLRGTKAPGVKSYEDRFALTLETTMNEIAADGWEYLRADTLPCEQRDGLMSKTTVYQNMLVFRRTKPSSSAPKMKPQRQAPAAPAPTAVAPPVAPPVATVQKKIVTKDDKPAPDVAGGD